METSHGYTAIPSPELAALLDRALPEIAAEIEAAAPPKLRAVVLGGGYGRGEGGVRHTAQGDRLYNDLDFFVFSSGADRAAAGRIDAELKKIAANWEKKLGIAVDFGPAKNLNSLKGVAKTLMYQELLRGWLPVWGRVELEQWLPALEPEALPFTEAARLLLNRGMGLVFAGEYLREGRNDPDFIVRNMNKAVLGAGDALLIADGRYRWRGAERVEEFAAYVRREKVPAEYAECYETAFRRKLEPDPVLPARPPAEWRRCRGFFLDAVQRVAGADNTASPHDIAAGLSRRAKRERSLKNLLRWGRRTGLLRSPFAAFDAPVVTLLGRLYGELAAADRAPVCAPELRRLWEFFN